MSFSHAWQAWRAFLTAGLFLAALQGCALLDVADRTPPNLYTLTAPELSGAPATDAQVSVVEPFASAAFDTNRIVYKPDANEIQYFAGARWTDRAPRMLQGLLASGLDTSDRFGAVGRKGTGISPDYELRMDLRAFSVENADGGAKTVRIAVTARLADYASDKVIAARNFEVTRQAAATADAAALVKQFDSAFAEVTRGLADWMAAEIGAHRAGA